MGKLVGNQYLRWVIQTSRKATLPVAFEYIRGRYSHFMISGSSTPITNSKTTKKTLSSLVTSRQKIIVKIFRKWNNYRIIIIVYGIIW